MQFMIKLADHAKAQFPVLLKYIAYAALESKDLRQVLISQSLLLHSIFDSLDGAGAIDDVMLVLVFFYQQGKNICLIAGIRAGFCLKYFFESFQGNEIISFCLKYFEFHI